MPTPTPASVSEAAWTAETAAAVLLQLVAGGRRRGTDRQHDDLRLGVAERVDGADDQTLVVVGSGCAGEGREERDDEDHERGEAQVAEAERRSHQRLDALRAKPSGWNTSGPRRMPRSASFSANFGPHAGGLEVAVEPAVLVDAHAVVEQEDVLEGDDVALHALHLGDVGDAAGAVTEAGEVHDQVERRGHLLADGPDRQVEAGHQHHGLDAGERVARAVGVDGGDRAVVAGVHGLEHVEGLAGTALADDDAVGAHAQAVA